MKQFFRSLATDQMNGIAVFPVKFLLWIGSVMFHAIVVFREVAYKTGVKKNVQLGKPVISVGNLTVGGTGKTPLVKYITKFVCNRGRKPVILTRGYMDQSGRRHGLSSDEAVMLQKDLPNVPVLVGANRIRSALEYLQKNEADIFILDDGYQHLQLARHLDIVTVDAANPWGNGCLLPRGILREPVSALSRASLIILTKVDLGKENVQQIKRVIHVVNAKVPIIEAVHKPVGFFDLRSRAAYDLTVIKRKAVCAVSSLGAPDAFEHTLTNLGGEIGKHFKFPDHYAYSADDIACIVDHCRRNKISSIVTTEKDAVKLKPFSVDIPDNYFVLSLKIKIDIVKGEEQLLERIHRLL